MSAAKKPFHRTEDIYIDDIEVCDGRRPINDAAVTVLAASMEKLGLKIPISVRLIVGDLIESDGLIGGLHEEFYQLIAGAHRLAAAKKT
jgi:ParB-like chromosome segregation protein Spo0J